MIKFRKKLALILLPVVIIGLYFVVHKSKASQVQAMDPMVVTYNGNSPPEPMFTITDMLPGDEEERTFNVLNSSLKSIQVQMKAIKTHEEENFSDILDIEITDLNSNTSFFSGKSGELFLSPPINIGTFTPGQDKHFRIKVKFPNDAGNEYKNAVVVFNIKWFSKGHNYIPQIPLTDGCKELKGKINNLIEGDEGGNILIGTSKNDLIIGHGGNDKIFGLSGHDCIVTGDGDDFIISGSGNDRVFGGGGNDIIFGGSGDDLLDGEAGNDTLNGGTGNDSCINGEHLFFCEL
jgi:hypothetical protein